MWYSNHSVVGLFIEGAYKGPGGDFQVLKDYLVGRMLWHPQPTIVDANNATQLSDTEELSSFLEGYYGPAASLVELYMATIHGAVALSDNFAPHGTSQTVLTSAAAAPCRRRTCRRLC